MHTTLKIVEGRKFEPGKNEIIAGRAAARQFVEPQRRHDAEVGREHLDSWSASSTTADAVSESELWCDVKVLQPAYRRGNSYQSVYARLASPDSFQQLKDALTTDPQLTVSRDARSRTTTAARPQTLQTIIRTIGGIIAGPDGHRRGVRRGEHDVHRRREPHPRNRHAARARVRQHSRRGFGACRGRSCWAIVGGVIGGAIAWLAFDGYQTATMNFQSFSQIAFAFAVTPQLLLTALVISLVMGLLAVFSRRFGPPLCQSSLLFENSDGTAQPASWALFLIRSESRQPPTAQSTFRLTFKTGPQSRTLVGSHQLR